MKQFKNSSETLDKNPQLFDKYPDMIGDLIAELFTVDGEAKWPKERRLAMKLLTSENPFRLIKTAIDMRRVII
jgi:electron transfer flavoprotein-quinone oxidoreductase